jgi:hypothetical protein
MKRLSIAKAEGPLDLANEVIKAALTVPWIFTRFRAIIISVMDWGAVTISWWYKMICSVHMKGNVAVAGNYLQISLTVTLRKMFEAIIISAIEEERDLAPALNEYRNGFCSKRRTVNPILALEKTIVAYYRHFVLSR